MKAVVFEDVGRIALRDVSEPHLEAPGDAVVRVTASAVGGTDLHLVRGSIPGVKPGTVLGHEGVGVVEEVGAAVRNLLPGDRVVVLATIACGACPACHAGLSSQCDRANPLGSQAGPCIFGSPQHNGGIQGLQAERARIPLAATSLVRIPDDMPEEHAIFLSDILPTGLWAADLAGVGPGVNVVVFGCGAVGLMAIAAVRARGASRVLAVDGVPGRLDAARRLGAEPIFYDVDDPVEASHDLTHGTGVDVVIDAVGVDANHPERGPAARRNRHLLAEFAAEVQHLAHGTAPRKGRTVAGFLRGTAPSQVLHWALDCVAKNGTLVVLGSYPPGMRLLPVGDLHHRNITLRAGVCPHRAYVARALEALRTRTVDPSRLLSHVKPLDSVAEVYRSCDERRPGWMKVELSAVAVH